MEGTDIDDLDDVLSNEIGDSGWWNTGCVSHFLWLQPDALDGVQGPIHLKEKFPCLLCFIVVVELDREDTVLVQRTCVDVYKR